jgi:SAM-dependent methyltransferase
MTYDVREYWSRVGSEIAKRGKDNVIAGDDDPYFRMKRAKFVTRFLRPLPVDGRVTLEVGCGPGGNLAELDGRPSTLYGVDISPVMVDLASRRSTAIVKHIDGRHLPFDDRSIDLTFTSTVLQHNVEWSGCAALMAEIARVTREQVVLMEDIGDDWVDEDRTYTARRIAVYADEMLRLGFQLTDSRFLGTRVSRRVRAWAYRLIHQGQREGEPVGWKATAFLSVVIPLTRLVDHFVTDNADAAQLVFSRR